MKLSRHCNGWKETVNQVKFEYLHKLVSIAIFSGCLQATGKSIFIIYKQLVKQLPCLAISSWLVSPRELLKGDDPEQAAARTLNRIEAEPPFSTPPLIRSRLGHGTTTSSTSPIWRATFATRLTILPNQVTIGGSTTRASQGGRPRSF